MLQADFVLVCLSPQYLQEVKGLDSAAGPPPGPRSTKPTPSSSAASAASSGKLSKGGALHSTYIYQLMQEEFQRVGHCTRFVPLYMEGSACREGPAWLTGHVAYHWPRQYKDLLWMLTKPEDRIKQRSSRSSPSPQKGHSNALKANGLHHGGGHLLSSPLT